MPIASVAIIGSTGYAGQEVLDRVLAHGQLELRALGSDTLAGRPASALDPRLGRNGSAGLPWFIPNDAALAAGADVVFLCLDHERAAAVVPPRNAVVIDLSGAHRLGDGGGYADWYGFDHPHAAELDRWSYGLPEVCAPEGRLVANPGCYATAALLALAPLAELVDPASVVVDAKSGVSGAGRTLKESSHAGSVLENVSAYRVGSHQHAPEIARVLGFPVCFAPHLLPVRRGLIATCYVMPHAGADVRGALEAAYAATPLVDVLPPDVAPELGRVQGTDTAEIGVYEDRSTGRAIVICALDNLGKGAAGQAVQNANVLFGYDETAGLRHAGVLV